jgi:hypothetical protein
MAFPIAGRALGFKNHAVGISVFLVCPLPYARCSAGSAGALVPPRQGNRGYVKPAIENEFSQQTGLADYCENPDFTGRITLR